jgi:hypothetical protein
MGECGEAEALVSRSYALTRAHLAWGILSAWIGVDADVKYFPSL